MSEQNAAIKRRQRLIFASIAGVLVVAAGLYLTTSEAKQTNAERAEDLKTRRAMTDVINPPGMADDFLSETGTRLQAVEGATERLEAQVSQLSGLLTERDRELAQTRAELTETRDQAAAMVEDLAARVASAETSPQPVPPVGPAGSFSPAAADPFQRAGAVSGSARPQVSAPQPVPALPPAEPRRMEIIRFEPASAEYETGVLQPAVFDLQDGDYVPPNAYARATVLVGVDMTTGVKLGSDPKPVLLRITGPAYSVMEGGRQLDTDIAGCLVNGAAHAELSSERVYIRLQKITCERGGGEVAESAVEGYVAQLGKAGVRGRVVSREGDIVTKALVAGTLSGVGSGISRTSDFGAFSTDGGATTVIGTDRPDAGEIAAGAIGEGLTTAADTVADYLIDRAEQYQPVIEMPTGIEVELVFLSGFYARGDQP